MVSFRLDSHGYMLVAAREVHHGAMRSYESIGGQVFGPIFAAEGKTFNPRHPDNENPDNTPLVLYYKDRSIAAARLDLLPSPVVKTATLRLIAVRPSHQCKGYGRILMQKVEEYAQDQEIAVLALNAMHGATGFYRKLGYQNCAWDDLGLPSRHIQMAKIIPPRAKGLSRRVTRRGFLLLRGEPGYGRVHLRVFGFGDVVLSAVDLDIRGKPAVAD